MLVEALAAIAIGWLLGSNAPQADTVAAAIRDAGVPSDAVKWLKAKSWIESRGNNSAINWDDGPYALKASQRLRSEGRLCPSRSPDEYAFTGGPWGLMPSVFIVTAYGSQACLTPQAVFSPREALAMVLAYAGRLQRSAAYKANPTWETLWLGFQRPAFMGDRSSDRAQKSLENMRAGLARYGASKIAKRRPPKFSPDGYYWRNRIVLGGAV